MKVMIKYNQEIPSYLAQVVQHTKNREVQLQTVKKQVI